MKLTIISILILLSSCSKSHWQSRGIRNGWYLSDTVTIKGETKQGETKVVLDSAKLDSIAEILANHYQDLLDSCGGADSTSAKKAIVQKYKIKELIKQIPCEIKPIDEKYNRYDLKIWISNGTLKYDLKIHEIKQPCNCPPCDKIKWYQWWYIGVIGTLVLIIGFIWLSNKFGFMLKYLK